MMEYGLIVIGGGPAGMMAASSAARRGLTVCLIEKNQRCGRKLLLTGNGRCNLTSTVEPDAFIAAYEPSGRFLYSAFSRFSNYDLMDYCAERGLETIVEGDRVFPLTMKSSDVLRLLMREMEEAGVQLRNSTTVKSLLVNADGTFTVLTDAGDFMSAQVVIAAGGQSYPQTGSSGDGYRLAESMGHSVTALQPALCGLVLESYSGNLQGLTVSNVAVTMKKGKRKLSSATGDILFTHYGLSGPVILNMSLQLAKTGRGEVSLELDLLPRASEEALRTLFRELHNESGRRMFRTVLNELLPQRMVKVICTQALSEKDKALNQVTSAEMDAVISLIKTRAYGVKDLRGYAEAMLTYGGVDLREVNARTMESKIQPGLYLCGEVLNINGRTGGFNLQAAFSTGFAAGQSVK